MRTATGPARRHRRVALPALTVAAACAALLLGPAATATPGPTDAGGTITLGGGLVTIPSADVGPVNLHALPLGDGQDSSSPEAGHIDLCNPGMLQPAPNGGSLPWIHGSTWDLTQKAVSGGSVSWPNATFQNVVHGSTRTIRRNDLPVGEPTGTFPVRPSDPAFPYRPDESIVEPNSFAVQVPAKPKVANTPTCLAGDAGVTLDGVALLDGFDANGRDAGANEVQDACNGHPNALGYHRHAMPFCLLARDTGTGQSGLLGYALDGFGIYGPRGANGKVLTNADLDACHGTTSTVVWNGKKVRMYHYVFTWQFPYTVGCLRGAVSSQHIFNTGGEGGAALPPGAPPGGGG
ncbi:MAG TPA: YHYH protein [Acidimicrobiia bacterium]